MDSARDAQEQASGRSPLGRLAVTAIGLEILLGVGAIGGGLALMAGPNGEILPLPVAALSGSPFANYFVPGAILFTIIGLGPLGAAVLAWRRHPVAPLLAFAVGVALLIWLVVEIELVGYSSDPPLQALYLGLGATITFVGVGWIVMSSCPSLGTRRRRVELESHARTVSPVRRVSRTR
ncbi:MAG TPA: hypothetical protein VIK01_06310 [Polyangiaceae bacterium]